VDEPPFTFLCHSGRGPVQAESKEPRRNCISRHRNYPRPLPRGFFAGRRRRWRDRGRAATVGRAQVRHAPPRAHPVCEVIQTGSRRRPTCQGARPPAPVGGFRESFRTRRRTSRVFSCSLCAPAESPCSYSVAARLFIVTSVCGCSSPSTRRKLSSTSSCSLRALDKSPIAYKVCATVSIDVRVSGCSGPNTLWRIANASSSSLCAPTKSPCRAASSPDCSWM